MSQDESGKSRNTPQAGRKRVRRFCPSCMGADPRTASEAVLERIDSDTVAVVVVMTCDQCGHRWVDRSRLYRPENPTDHKVSTLYL